MKKTVTILSLAITTLVVNATVITVNNNSNSPGQYTNLQTAIDAANAGDTIYVSGSATSYGDINLTKRLALFGAGSNPQKQSPLASILGNLFLDSLPSSANASGSIIAGFTIFYLDKAFGYPDNFNNIRIIRNNIQVPTIAGFNWLIESNIIGSVILNNNDNVIIKNNIFTNGASTINYSNKGDVNIINNLFISIFTNNSLNGVSNATISNNIFYSSSPGGCVGCTFNNNLTYNTPQDILPYGTNFGSGNITNQDPLFTFIQNVNYTFTPTDDYRLLIASPGHNAGTDGTDIGPFGGSNPIPSSPVGGEPCIPQVKTMNIANTVIPVNGTINLSVKGKKQN